MTRKEELIAKVKHLHQVLESHPYITGLQTNQCHRFLNDIARNAGFVLTEIEGSELMHPLTEQEQIELF